MLEWVERIVLGICEQAATSGRSRPLSEEMKPPPLLMVGLFAFMSALMLFGVLLVAPTGPPMWLWAFNGAGLAYAVACFGYWCRQAAATGLRA